MVRITFVFFFVECVCIGLFALPLDHPYVEYSTEHVEHYIIYNDVWKYVQRKNQMQAMQRVRPSNKKNQNKTQRLKWIQMVEHDRSRRREM